MARRLLAFRREAVLASPSAGGGGGAAAAAAASWDPRVVEMQLSRGEMEMEEAVKQWKQRGHLMALIKPELAPRDPVLDVDEHMARVADGSLTLADFTRGYKPSELARAARSIEAALAAGSYKAPRRLPGSTAASATAAQVVLARAEREAARLQ